MAENKIKGTLTEQNLVNSFAGESLARNRYTFFAKVAKEEGYEQIAAIFEETAKNEEAHAKQFYKLIPDGQKQVQQYYPFEYGNTEENLESAIAGEDEEANILYYNGAQTAREEGFEDIARQFEAIIISEKHHSRRYQKLLKNIKEKTVFCKEEETKWMCRKCGYVLESKCAPNKCPNCHHPQGYFEVLCETY